MALSLCADLIRGITLPDSIIPKEHTTTTTPRLLKQITRKKEGTGGIYI